MMEQRTLDERTLRIDLAACYRDAVVYELAGEGDPATAAATSGTNRIHNISVCHFLSPVVQI